MRLLHLAVLTAITAAPAMAPAMAQAPAQLPAMAPEVFVDALEGTFGTHRGERRSHAKGVCAVGHFVGTAEARALSSASLFDGGRHAAVLRFSVGGGNPRAPDKARSVRGLAVAIDLPRGEQFVSANLSAPVFFVGTPANFPRFLESRRPDPATGMADPARVRAFNEANPDVAPQIAFLAAAPIPASYATVPYWGIHAFRFTNAASQAAFASWRFQPAAGVLGLTAEQIQSLPNDFLIDELRTRVGREPVAFDMVLRIAEAGDNVASSVVTWPETRREVIAGRLTVTGVSPDAAGACRDMIFDPTLLPAGIAPGDDPVFHARSAPYAVSATRRLAN